MLIEGTELALALLIVRVCIGLTLAAHGYNKFFGGGRISGAAGWFGSIGMKGAKFQAFLAATLEMGCGLFFAAGLLTTFAATGFVGLMMVAALVVHIKNGFFITKEGWEYTFVLKVIAIVVAMLGPGEWSVDNLLDIADKFDGWWGLVIAGGGGFVGSLLFLAAFHRRPKPVETQS